MKCRNERCRPSVFGELERGIQSLMREARSADRVSSDSPYVSVLEFDNRYVVECDLPGVGADDIELQVEENVLTIRGERRPVAAAEKSTVLHNERTPFSFARQVKFARQIDPSAIDAELVNGVLRITTPKRAEVLPQKITVKGSSPTPTPPSSET